MLVERRRVQRTPWNRPATALWSDVRTRCLIHDISALGARVIVERDAVVPEQFVLSLTQDDKVARQCRVIWRSRTHVGVEFQAGSAAPRTDAETADPDAIALDC